MAKIKTYDNIYNKISNINQKNAVAKYVRAYVLQLIDIVADLELHIISIGSDGELIDSYLNRNITHHARIEMAMIAMQTFNIMISLVESLVLLIKIHRDYYENIPLLIWKHGTESCEHIFEAACQFRSDFTFLEILQIVPKINVYYFNIHKKFSTSQLEDFWNEDLNLETSNNNEYNTDSGLSVSHCINNAISEMNRNQKVNSDPEPELSLEKLYMSCSRSEFTLDNISLNIEFLLNLHQRHDAHSKKTLE
ncbi:5005_t:CDS:2 [Gigaspora rosea]|nr:5005_t:CDS:2 [Gigaspora rosea]